MASLRERIEKGEVLFCDGAMGTFLQARGMQPGECPELWSVEHADVVQEIHTNYRAAGSDMAETNSFGGTTFKLRHYGLADRCDEINRAAAAVARAAAGPDGYVLGSMGPTGEFMEPYGTETQKTFYAAFRQQAEALAAGGADAVIVETMTGVEEAAVAVKAAKENTNLVVMVSFTFDPKPGGEYVTMMGVKPSRYAKALTEAGADVIGANCGTGPTHMIEIVTALRQATDRPIIAMPNAGMPQVENGQTVFKETPEQMAAKAPRLVAAGATIIGGCCGTTPAHIAAMRRAILG